MFRGPALRSFRLLLALPLLLVLGGCNMVLLSPAGDVAVQQRNLLVASTALMLLIIVPVMALTAWFAWHYRQGNAKAVFDPRFDHSIGLEVVIWSVPLLIIIALGALTWLGTHLLDPYRPVSRISATKAIPSSGDAAMATGKPLVVQVVALDWKWMFLYPGQGIATVNELAAPVDVPIEFHITSATVMNSFFVPALAGQIYAMAGMETKLHAVINAEGDYKGFSANYSGAGFSRMNFTFHGLSQQGFDAWVDRAKQSDKALDDTVYAELEKPSEAEPVRYFSSVRSGLYDAILNLCAQPGKMCMSEMMHIDAKGGGGKDSEANRERLIYDGHRGREGVEEPGATFPASGRPPNSNVQPQGMKPDQLSPEVNQRGGEGGTSGAMPGMPGMSDDVTPAPAQMHKH